MVDLWRVQAYCPSHSRLETIQRLLSSVSRGKGEFQADVVLVCGETLKISTSADNLAAIDAYTHGYL